MQKAVDLDPQDFKALNNLGVMFNDLAQHEKAATYTRQAIKLYPDFAEAFGNLASILKNLQQFSEAESAYRKAIDLLPNFAPMHFNLGLFLRSVFRYIEALQSIQKAIQIDPNMAAAHEALSTVQGYLSDYHEVFLHSKKALELNSRDEQIWESRLFTWIYHPDLSAQEICDEHVRWGNLQPDVPAPSFIGRDKDVGRRLRVGYVSPDFRQHTCRFYFDPLFANHDHEQVELFAYSNVSVEDDHTLRMKGYFDHWRSIRGVSDAKASELIQRDGIDILVDACGHMASTRLGVFVHRPAPIQVTWLGAAWTTGLKQMDYAVFDPHMAPEGTCTSEEIVRLPRTWAAFRPGEKAMSTGVAELPALRTGQITFGYSGRTERLNYKVFSVWAKILQRLPSARLILDYRAFGDPLTQEYYREFLARHGMDVTRVVMRSSDNIFEALGEIDILLDSFPHSGGTMLFDSLWMGVPALTLASRPPVGRIGTSLMTNLGLSEWVAKDEQEYEDKAVSFAQDVAHLAGLRSGMRARMQASPVMDEVGFARDIEQAYRGMWQRWCARQQS
jgi:predicted O-linked N-acetylglucosamine transferase (SPINDLY family)